MYEFCGVGTGIDTEVETIMYYTGMTSDPAKDADDYAADCELALDAFEMCPICHEKLSLESFKNCEDCWASVCQSCRTRCPRCREVVCDNCADANGLCVRCSTKALRRLR